MNLYRKITLICLFVILLTAQKNYSQVDTVWTRQFNYGTYNRGMDVLETPDSSYMLVGFATESILIKADLSGNTKWVKKFNYSEYGQFRKILRGNDSSYYVLSNNYNFSKLYSFDLEGNIKWSLLLQNDTSTEVLFTSNMIQYEDNGVYLIGKIGDLETKIWIAKVNPNGEYEWTNTIDVPYMVNSNEINFIKSNEGFFIQVNPDMSVFYFLRTDSLGNKIKEIINRPENIFSQSFNSIAYIDKDKPDSGYVITGEQMGNLALVRLDTEGNVLWSKTYERYTPSMNFGNSVINSPNGGWIIFGGTGDNTSPKSFIIQTDWEGNLVWDNDYSNSYGQTIFQTNDNGYIACGTKAKKDIWLLKFDVTPIAKIIGDSLWYDSDWNGMASGQLNGLNSASPNGFQITKFEWSINDSIISNESSVNLNLPTGLTEVKLKVTDESGASGSKILPVQVYSYKMETDGSISSSISTIGDSIFFATSEDDQIYCFDRNNKMKWTLLTGGDIQSTTTIGPKNNIYVGSGDTRLYNFNLEGNFLWDKPVGGVITASPAITKNGTIYVGTSTNRLYSIKSEDGSINWNYLVGGSISSSASVSANGDVYFGSKDTYFYSINSAGELNWKFKTSGEINSSPAIDAFGNIYFGSNDTYFYSLNSSGDLNWKYKTNGAIVSSPVLDEYGYSYFGSGDGYLYAIDNNGQLLWKYNAESSVNGNPSIALNKDIIFGCDDGKVISLKNSGELNWYYKTDSSIKAAPLITADGRIYVGSSDKSIYGFIDPNYKNISEGIAKLQWPTFQKDNQRTGSLYDTETSVKSINNNSLSNTFTLYQNYPNPFNPTTNIRFGIAEASKLEFYIYNITGERIRTISENINSPGYYSISWDGLNDRNQQVGSGVYIFQMKAVGENKTFIQSIKIIKLK